MDYGFHPPTVYFPLVVPEALMIEPTETEAQGDARRVRRGDARDRARGRGGARAVARPRTARPLERLDEARAAYAPSRRRRRDAVPAAAPRCASCATDFGDRVTIPIAQQAQARSQAERCRIKRRTMLQIRIGRRAGIGLAVVACAIALGTPVALAHRTPRQSTGRRTSRPATRSSTTTSASPVTR